MEAFHFVFTILHAFLLTGSIFSNGLDHGSVYVTEGDDVHLLCNTTVRAPVWWHYKCDNSDHRNYIHMGSAAVVPKYQPRFKVDNQTYTLTIHNATISDSGLYSCVDDDGFGQTHAVWLTVGKRNDSMSFENIASSSDDTSMVTSHVVLIIVLLSLVIIVATVVVFVVVKRFKGTNDNTIEVNELHEIIPSPGMCEYHENEGSVRGQQIALFSGLPFEVREIILTRAALSWSSPSSSLSLWWASSFSGVEVLSHSDYIARLITLNSVCSDWWFIITSRPYIRRQLRQNIKCACRPYLCRPQLVKQLDTKSVVCGLTQVDDKIFVVCFGSDTIRVFGLNNEQLEDIKVKGLEDPEDIVACSETRSLYVADVGWSECVWRVSTGHKVDKFLPTTTSSFSPKSLSVTSGRLLVTTNDDVLLMFGTDGVELKRLSFADMFSLQHAVETSRDTFVFCHHEPQPQVVEVDGDGLTISVYSDQQQLTRPCHLSTDSEGEIFIADYYKHRILLLTKDLQFNRVLLDTQHNHLVELPWRLFYVQQTRHLLVSSDVSPVVQVFAVG